MTAMLPPSMRSAMRWAQCRTAAGALKGSCAVDQEPAVQLVQVQKWRDVALLQASQALKLFPHSRLNPDYLYVRVALLQKLPDPHERPAGPDACDEYVRVGQGLQYLRAGRLVVRPDVGLALKLACVEAALLLAQLPRQLDCPLHARHGVAPDDFSVVGCQQVRHARGRSVGDDHLQPVALLLGDERQRQRGVACAGLHQGLAGLERAGRLRLPHKVSGDPVLDAARRVEALQLGEDAHPRLGAHAGHLHKGRVAYVVQDTL